MKAISEHMNDVIAKEPEASFVVYDNVTEFVKSLSYFFESGKTVRWLVNTGESAAPNNQLILFTNSVQE